MINDYVSGQQQDLNLIVNNIELIKKRYSKVKLYTKLVNKFYIKQGGIKPWNFSIFDISTLNKIPRNEEFWGMRGIRKISESQGFIDSLVESFNESLIDLGKCNKKNLDSFSYYFPDRNLTYISVSAQNDIHDNIYFYHEIGHAFFNYMNHIPNYKMTLRNLYESEKMAYKFEIKYTKLFLHKYYEYYQYNFYSLLCMFAVKSAFEVYCHLYANSNSSDKSKMYQILVRKFTPWIYSTESFANWCMQKEILGTPFYDLAYFLSQGEAIQDLE